MFNDFLLLIRAKSPMEGVARVKNNLLKFGCDEKLLNRINERHILSGDLAEPDNFLNDDRLLNVTHVINAAAIASFSENALIWKVNVEGTLKFAKKMASIPT